MTTMTCAVIPVIALLAGELAAGRKTCALVAIDAQPAGRSRTRSR
jgi:hypothetical protein